MIYYLRRESVLINYLFWEGHNMPSIQTIDPHIDGEFESISIVGENESADVIVELDDSKTFVESGVYFTSGIHPELGSVVVISFGSTYSILGIHKHG